MPYEILSHTADLRLKIWAISPENLFSEALRAVAEILGKRENKEKLISRKISVTAPNKTVLLVDFLNEILALSQINKEIYEKVDFLKFWDNHLEAKVKGRKVDSFNEDIKAVTYHQADIKQNKDGFWEATLVFDI